MAPRVMTVSGPIPPDKLGFTLPHEHTGIYLWHVDKRWDYWELTPDEDLITDELRDLRRRGGATLSTSRCRASAATRIGSGAWPVRRG
jgi:predicted metal-dependent phosphotriesterase family hydrolase